MIRQKQRDWIVSRGRLRKGITVPEIAMALDVSWDAAYRAVRRLMREGKLYKIARKRRRDLLFERAGRGADIYKARPKKTKEKETWESSRTSRKRRSSRAESASRR